MHKIADVFPARHATETSAISWEDIVVLYRLPCLMFITLLLINEMAAQKLDATSQVPRKEQSTNASRNTGWYDFTSQERDFIVKFPLKPEQGTNIDGLGGAIRRYNSTKGSLLFQLMFWDTGFAPTSQNGNQFPTEFRRDMLDQAKQENWTVIRSQLLDKNIYEQERWTPTDSNPDRKIHLIVRHVRRYGREYILSCSSLIPDKTVNLETCRQFFNSFRVTGEPQPQ